VYHARDPCPGRPHVAEAVELHPSDDPVGPPLPIQADRDEGVALLGITDHAGAAPELTKITKMRGIDRHIFVPPSIIAAPAYTTDRVESTTIIRTCRSESAIPAMAPPPRQRGGGWQTDSEL